jgi:hypothetical protein
MGDTLNVNTTDIVRVAWLQGGNNVCFRSYSGSAGTHPLLISNIPGDVASALVCLMASGVSQPMEVELPYQVEPTFTNASGLYEAVYYLIRVGQRLE